MIVSKRINSDGSGTYYARIFYENSIEALQVNSGTITPPFILRYVYAYFDTNGALNSLAVSAEGSNTIAQLDIETEESTYDIVTGVKTILPDSYQYLDTCTDSGAVTFCDSISKINGVQNFEGQSMSIKRLLGSGTIGSMSFSDLRGRDKYYGSSHSYRIAAKGIGRIMRINDGVEMRVPIYYYVNGATDGSLVGTPFDSGAVPFGGLFF